MPRDVRLIGTPEWPIRPSGLKLLRACPMSWLLDESRENAGAQTGSLLHLGVEQYHKNLLDAEVGRLAMHAAAPSFPLARVEEAHALYAQYVTLPENQTHPVIECEVKVSGYVHGIFLQGTADQIRRDPDGTLRLWDLKTGTFLTPSGMLDAYKYQQAAYVLLARQTLGLDVHPGGLIRAAGLGKRFGQVWVRYEKETVESCEKDLTWLKDTVYSLRQGERRYQPGPEACRFCPARPHPECTTKEPL